MNLHNDKESFENLISVTSKYIGVPADAIKRDYFIVKLLQNLQNSKFCDCCVFKGGTSLSKCYPNSINRFSEDIDLTFIPNDKLSKKQYDNSLKQMEKAIIGEAYFEKIDDERNDRNKSSYVWFANEDKARGRIKLEIGSSIKPEPYEKRKLKTYIQEYLEDKGRADIVFEYQFAEIEINVLNIERTFLDKVFSVKRHAICGSLGSKVRHIYDVTKLYKMSVIQDFLSDKDGLKNLINITKQTDSFYLEKRGMNKEYNPTDAYDFSIWKQYFTKEIKDRYESLHEDLLYDNEKQDLDIALITFEEISALFAEIGE
ncbi:MAG: nucleotidyl transferase AbiEii/AbiGii toxin family protein [Saccharofermentanales bacterium]